MSSHGIQWDPISLPAPFLAALPGPAPLSLQKCIFQRLEKLVWVWLFVFFFCLMDFLFLIQLKGSEIHALD